MHSVVLRSLENPQYLSNSCKDFDKTVEEYTDKQKSDAALKILIELYRLLDNPLWKNNVDAELLCLFSLHLSQFVKTASPSEIQKFLATVCNIHRCVVKKKVPVSLSLLLAQCAVSNSGVEMSSQYSKLYWIILVDCMAAVDASDSKENVKIVMDIILKISNIVKIQFCKENLLWILKKFFILLNTSAPNDLNVFIVQLFDSLSQNKDICLSKGDNAMEYYKSLLLCCTIIHQNIASCGYQHSNSLNAALKFSLKLLESEPEYFDVIQNLLKIVPILTLTVDKLSQQSQTLVSDFIKDNFVKIKLSSATVELFSVLRKMLHSSLSYWLTVDDKVWKKYIKIEIQSAILKLLVLISKESQSDAQVVKCSNCKYKNAIHDSIALGYLPGMFCSKSAKCNLDIISLMQSVTSMSSEQMANLKSLHVNSCPNWKTFWGKMETDLHNNAIYLYSIKNYRHSYSLFEIYISSCTQIMNWDFNACDQNHLSRGFYNMAICQSDLDEQYNAIVSCYISLAINSTANLSKAHGMTHSNFAVQIKSKTLSAISKRANSTNDDMNEEENDDTRGVSEKIQALTVWNACREFLSHKENLIYLKIFSQVDFGKVMLSELQAYVKLWPSTRLIVGICQSLQELLQLASPLKISPATSQQFGILCIKSLTLTAGKIVTIITTNPTKLFNPQVIEFVVVTIKLLEDYLKKMTSKDTVGNIAIVKLLLGNTLMAHSFCEIQTKRKLGAQKVVAEVTPTAPSIPHQPAQHPDDACDVAPAHQYLSLEVEDDLLQPVYRAIDLWREGVNDMGQSKEKFNTNTKSKVCLENTAEIIETACQVLALQGVDVYSLHAADIAYSLSLLIENRLCTLRTAGFLLEHAACSHKSLEPIILNSNKIVKGILKSDDKVPEDPIMMNASFEYLLNLSIYYYNIGLKNSGLAILSSVNSRMMADYLTDESNDKRNFEDIKFSFVKLMVVQSLYGGYEENKVEGAQFFGILTCLVNAHAECGEFVRNSGAGRVAAVSQRLWLDSGAEAGRVALALGLVRRARALLRTPLAAAQKLLLPRRAAHLLTNLAAADLAAERYNDCIVKLDGIRYILHERHNIPEEICKKANTKSVTQIFPLETHLSSKIISTGHSKQFEMVLDFPEDKFCNPSLGGSPTFRPPPFSLPEFVSHQNKCNCFKCSSLTNVVIHLDFMRIQAQLHFKTGESSVTESFYNGGLKLIKYLKAKVEYILENNSTLFLQSQLVNVLKSCNEKNIINAQCQFMVDANYFFITENETDKAFEINTKTVNKLEQVINCDHFLIHMAKEQRLFLLQSNVFRENKRQSQLDIIDDLESDFSSKMIITPEKIKNTASFMTPCNKKITAVNRVVRNLGNALPSLRKTEFTDFARPAIKLSLDDDDEDEGASKKLPKPKTSKENKSLKISEFDIPKTPIPKLRNEKKIVLFNSPAKTPKTRAKINMNVLKKSDSKDSSGSEKDFRSTYNNPVFSATSSSASKVRVYGNKTKSKTMNSALDTEAAKIDKSKKQTEKSKLEIKSISEVDTAKKYFTRRRI